MSAPNARKIDRRPSLRRKQKAHTKKVLSGLQRKLQQTKQALKFHRRIANLLQRTLEEKEYPWLGSNI